MEIVAPQYRKTIEEVHRMVNNMPDNYNVSPVELLMIDFAYHNSDVDYEDGLSFLDRLHSKLGHYFNIRWNIANIKLMVRASNTPSVTFVDVLNELLTQDMIEFYGI
jgi:hypothetical protein